MPYIAREHRYDKMIYRRCGHSGVELPAISLGFWHNFGGVDTFENARAMAHRAFDLGITHFDLANNYGPPPGSAEDTLGHLLATDFAPYRDELIISTKAGYYMWPGPYGEWGSKKYLMASLDQSLKRMGLDYVDIFYSHRPDPKTPLEETMEALIQAVHQGKTLYVGISSYTPEQTRRAIEILGHHRIHLLIHQPQYSLLNRWIETELQKVLEEHGVGSIAFSPLSQGLLTNRYLSGIPTDSRASKPSGALDAKDVNEPMLSKIRQLHALSQNRGQSLAQMAIAWVLRNERVTSALVGASRLSQIKDNVAALDNLKFTDQEIHAIDAIIGG